MLIPYQEVSEVALQGLAREYVISNLSEVEVEMDIEIWTNKVIDMVKRSELLIEFSEENESFTLKNKGELF